MDGYDYYFLNNQSYLANKLGLTVIALGSSNPKLPFKKDIEKKVNFFTFSYLAKGKGKYKSKKTGELELKEGQIIVGFPGVAYTYGPEEGDTWEEYWVECKGSLPKSYLKKGIISPDNPIMTIGRKPELVHEFMEGVRVVQLKDPGYRENLTGIFVKIICRMLHFLELKGNSNFFPDERYMLEMIDVLKENYKETDTKKIFKAVKAPYKKLDTMFRRYLDSSIDKYFILMKIDEAKENLLYTHKDIREIGYELGFHDLGYFSRLFKKYAGYSPQQFRSIFSKI